MFMEIKLHQSYHDAWWHLDIKSWTSCKRCTSAVCAEQALPNHTSHTKIKGYPTWCNYHHGLRSRPIHRPSPASFIAIVGSLSCDGTAWACVSCMVVKSCEGERACFRITSYWIRFCSFFENIVITTAWKTVLVGDLLNKQSQRWKSAAGAEQAPLIIVDVPWQSITYVLMLYESHPSDSGHDGFKTAHDFRIHKNQDYERKAMDNLPSPNPISQTRAPSSQDTPSMSHFQIQIIQGSTQYT